MFFSRTVPQPWTQILTSLVYHLEGPTGREIWDCWQSRRLVVAQTHDTVFTHPNLDGTPHLRASRVTSSEVRPFSNASLFTSGKRLDPPWPVWPAFPAVGTLGFAISSNCLPVSTYLVAGNVQTSKMKTFHPPIWLNKVACDRKIGQISTYVSS